MTSANKVPQWWLDEGWPLQCRKGHEWGPGKVIVSWSPCDCPGALKQKPHGHRMLSCNTGEKCRETWYRPKCSGRSTPFRYPAPVS